MLIHEQITQLHQQIDSLAEQIRSLADQNRKPGNTFAKGETPQERLRQIGTTDRSSSNQKRIS